MANRTVYLDNVWGKNIPDVPETPIEEIAYGKSSITPLEIETGWRYKKVESSAIFNEVMKRMTGILQLLEKYGVVPWCPNITYPVGALVIGSDALLYQALEVSLNKDPISEATYWQEFTNATDHINDFTGDVHGATISLVANKLVRRDGVGDFEARRITADLIGNATTATNATDHIAMVSGSIHGATVSNVASKLVVRSASGNFSAGTITATLSGNATTATNATDHIADITGAGHPAATAGGASGFLTGTDKTRIDSLYAASILQLLNASGYQEFAGGLILQWGEAVSSGTTANNVAIEFPKEFPTAFLCSIATVAGTNTGVWSVQIGAATTTGMYLSTSDGSGWTSGTAVRWFAVGK